MRFDGFDLAGCFATADLRQYSRDELYGTGLASADIAFLSEFGLPHEVDPFFRASDVRRLSSLRFDHPLIAVGIIPMNYSATAIAIDAHDRAIWAIMLDEHFPPLFVNSRIETYLYFLCRVPRTADDLEGSAEQVREHVDNLRRELLVRDAKALLDEESWWSAILLELEARLI